MTEKDILARGCGKLIITIVRRELGNRIVSMTKAGGARGGTVLPARGTSTNVLERLFGIGGSQREIVFTLVGDEDAPSVMNALRACGDTAGKNGGGYAVLIDVAHILRRGGDSLWSDSSERSEHMKRHGQHVVICVIVNRGCADEIMSAAYAAGASSGAILNARGTASEKDVEFLGVPLFPEKEILFILVRTELVGTIYEALRKNRCLCRPGGGIAFTVQTEEVVSLGKMADRG
ncbi:MAG: P-II family nitrogen regulator [Synergistaceae bacterium]|jgi:nitrogen regulatory protein PII|nr:P-II family nitrogen regulator [Synergistaceae bacterium]